MPRPLFKVTDSRDLQFKKTIGLSSLSDSGATKLASPDPKNAPSPIVVSVLFYAKFTHSSFAQFIKENLPSSRTLDGIVICVMLLAVKQ